MIEKSIDGVAHVVPRAVLAHLDEMQDAREKAEAHANYLASELRWFCDRVECGELYSKRTYESFKAALNTTGRADATAGSRGEEGKDASSSSTAYAFGIGAAVGATCGLLIIGIVALAAGA